MVSSAVKMSKAELERALARIKREHARDPEYQALRKDLPKGWPI
jgi:hypothetical protein